MKDQKLLVDLFSRLSHQQIFFAVWVVIVSVFVYLILRFQKSREQRNFKEGSQFPRPKSELPPADIKRLKK